MVNNQNFTKEQTKINVKILKKSLFADKTP